MTRLEKIEKSIEGLTPEELDAFADWFEAPQANRWDKRLEQDAASGKLDRLADAALTDHRAGRTRPL